MLGRCKSSEMPRFLFGKTADTNDSKKTGLLGRFRKKKNIIQDEIKIGSILPDIDVGVVSIRKGNNDNVISIKELFGGGHEGEAATKSTQILVGMPGAYTPACTKVHLPGFKNALSKLQNLGVDTVAIVTTNDRFVNEVWGQDLGIISTTTDEKDDDDTSSSTTTDDGSDNTIIMLSDGDAELVRAIGLAEDMGTFLQLLHALQHLFCMDTSSFGLINQSYTSFPVFTSSSCLICVPNNAFIFFPLYYITNRIWSWYSIETIRFSITGWYRYKCIN
jgi:peroxiredoxin